MVVYRVPYVRGWERDREIEVSINEVRPIVQAWYQHGYAGVFGEFVIGYVLQGEHVDFGWLDLRMSNLRLLVFDETQAWGLLVIHTARAVAMCSSISVRLLGEYTVSYGDIVPC